MNEKYSLIRTKDTVDFFKLAKKLGQEGQKFVRERYTWRSTASILDGIYRQLVYGK